MEVIFLAHMSKQELHRLAIDVDKLLGLVHSSYVTQLPRDYRTELQTLEIFYRKILKQILSIPTNTAYPAVYILAGAIPIESRIHKLALDMYANICRTNSIEREIAERQLGICFSIGIIGGIQII
jgi:hypothetical protein